MRTHLLRFFISWVLFFILYVLLVQSMASSLGLGGKSIGISELIEGSVISCLLAGISTLVMLASSSVIKKFKNKS